MFEKPNQRRASEVPKNPRICEEEEGSTCTRRGEESGGIGMKPKELEFGEASDEVAELVGAASGQGRSINKVPDLGVNLRREECNEEVEDVDAESVGDRNIKKKKNFITISSFML
ncbi:hypothetical protein MRB53_023631 [Persea americana]|uniref:Uncharacterized protein n=1 Tax=Persea americana TaxID=3435 RepID=A0ACC2LAI0_PERAE|nr:hypothetical protein MRB53_023631 [Persea americana]